jgi:hypothetical protein
MKFFADEFGFSPNETVALMGAHTLGSAIPHNSGFKASHHHPTIPHSWLWYFFKANF